MAYHTVQAVDRKASLAGGQINRTPANNEQ